MCMFALKECLQWRVLLINPQFTNQFYFIMTTLLSNVHTRVTRIGLQHCNPSVHNGRAILTLTVLLTELLVKRSQGAAR